MDYRSNVSEIVEKAHSPGVSQTDKSLLMSRASRLIMGNRIEEDLLSRKSPSPISERRFAFKNPHGHQREYLFIKILASFGCDCVKLKQKGNLVVFGSPEDIDRADWLYSIFSKYVLSQASVMRSLHYSAAARNSYILQYADEVARSLRTATKKLAEEDISGETALMLSDKKTRTRLTRNKKFPSLNTTSDSPAPSENGEEKVSSQKLDVLETTGG